MSQREETPMFAELDIKRAYEDDKIGYDTAMAQLRRLGFTEYAADKYLFSDTGHRR